MLTKTNLIYFSLALIYLINLSLFPSISWVLKILPIGLLLWVTFKQAPQPTKTFLVTALCFSASGDILLELNLFIFGVAAFLLAQLSYATLFVRDWTGIKQRWWASLGLLAYVFAMATVLVPTLGNLQIPVFAYLVAISFMGLMALQSNLPWRWAVAGALVFITSDSLIAIDKFLHPIPLRSYWIMITYYAAQWMLIAGFLSSSRPDRHG